MLIDNHTSIYDPFAQMYNEAWGPPYCQKIIPILEQLLLRHLQKGAQILDIGCGTGQILQQLLIKGYQVTGLDASEGMLHYARQNAPEGQFIQTDAGFFNLPPTFDAVVSTNAALNHFLNLQELTKVFQNVYETLLENGLFFFDMDMEEYYQSERWKGAIVDGDVKEEYAWAFAGSYNPENKIGQYQMTTFQLLKGEWQRSDSNWQLKAYTKEEIQSALEAVGFKTINVYDAQRDFSLHSSTGTVYFLCSK